MLCDKICDDYIEEPNITSPVLLKIIWKLLCLHDFKLDLAKIVKFSLVKVILWSLDLGWNLIIPSF